MQSLADPAKAACAGSGDGKSKWMRLSSKWTAEFLLDPACPEAGSWLQEQEQPWGIGCKACSFCKCVGRLAKFRVCTRSGLQSVNFVKHQKSKVHQNSVKVFLANGNDSGLNTAPDTSSFKVNFEQQERGSNDMVPCGGHESNRPKALDKNKECISFPG